MRNLTKKIKKRNKHRYHALKFNHQQLDLAACSKAEMARDSTNQQTQRFSAEWQNAPKTGEGSEFNKESREMQRRKRLGFMARKEKTADDFPWILSCKASVATASASSSSSASSANKERQFIGKKAVSENSSYFVFVKCADGGFEAHPLEDWYSFIPYRTYKTLNEEEAEEEYKRRHKTLNKLMIMANKRKNEMNGGDVDDDELDGVVSAKAGKASAAKSGAGI